ncbi:MAG: penicillin-binding transpeptidase domain-containing protein [Lachnospiraceae bacterium]|nr:penicillin-binding transpeptidase domain-containing protein [Lachnospiraceae bacterium]
MFDDFKANFFNMVTSRIFILLLVFIVAGFVMIHRIFDLQIVRGADFSDAFELKIRKERSIPATRGNIYDRNGNLLAYNDLSYSVTIEDVFESVRGKNAALNATIFNLIELIERCGDKTVSDFFIILDQDNNYAFSVEDRENRHLRRFLADVYGKRRFDDLDYREQSATAEEVVDFLGGTSRFGIGGFLTYEDEEGKERERFVVGLGFSKEDVLKIMTIRYDMSNNSFQRYIATTVATNVSEKTVAVVMENSDTLRGVHITEASVRRYVDSIYFAHILGYTGKISQEELENFRAQPLGSQYDMNDTIGKLGIEQSQEHILQGSKGNEVVFVNNVGKVIDTSDYVSPIAGNDVYLTIDKDLQIALYHILEEKIASIIYTKLRDIKEYVPAENANAIDIVIPIYDVYYALINNNVINLERLGFKDSGTAEQEVAEIFLGRKAEIIEALLFELTEEKTPYHELRLEYQVYQSLIMELLYQRGIISRDRINVNDETYRAWTNEEVLSLNEFLHYCISMNWVDITKLVLGNQYSDAAEIYREIINFIIEALNSSTEFDKRIFRFMIQNELVTGRQLCHILLEQEIIKIPAQEEQAFFEGRVTPYRFLRDRIVNLDITPAQLALDPFSGSVVITDVHTGDVVALVSYPSYDNNKMANGVDAAYYSSLLNDLSKPMINYATQQRTAPGSTFKIVTAVGAVLEGIASTNSTITCHGIFEGVTPSPRCWIFPRGTHGSLNMASAIRDSCNVYFYELGYQMGILDGIYSSNEGIEVLGKYASMFGLTEPTGIEIDEAIPQTATNDPVRAAIGQANSSYTTVALARYVTAVANGGTNYNLTLIDKITDRGGNLLYDNNAEISNTILLADSEWNAIKLGMRRMIERKTYFDVLSVNVAGKTGTAQENLNRPNHALFVGYAPYEEPEIGVAVRVAFGYSSDYAAQITRDVIKYYYGLGEREEIITGTAGLLQGGTTAVD